MAVKSGKKRVVITVSEQLLEKLDAYCEDNGVSRSSYIGTLLASQFDMQQKLLAQIGDLVKEMSEKKAA